jgi:GNAT superfamily N-acetyltransferase
VTEIRLLAEADLPEAQRIIRVAFGTFLGAPNPEAFWEDRDYAVGRFGAEHVASIAAVESGKLAGSNFATRWGSFGFFGPVTVRPDLWNKSAGQRLVAAACEAFEGWGLRHMGLFTFAQSAKHVWTYGKFGFHPRFLTAIMAAPVKGGRTAGWSRYSELPEAQRSQVIAQARDLTNELYEGLDLAAEIHTTAARKLGDTMLLWNGPSRLGAFAVCQFGPGSEAGQGLLYVKFAAVRAGSGAEQRFAFLLDACGELGAAVGMSNVFAGVNLAREEAYRHMLARGFRTQIQGVAMHRPNEPGFCRPGLFILDDWR